MVSGREVWDRFGLWLGLSDVYDREPELELERDAAWARIAELEAKLDRTRTVAVTRQAELAEQITKLEHDLIRTSRWLAIASCRAQSRARLAADVLSHNARLRRRWLRASTALNAAQADADRYARQLQSMGVEPARIEVNA